jgi:phenylalanyl-tRNA synthetase alpha chain
MDLKKLAATLHPLERKVLPVLKGLTDYEDIVKASGISEVEVMRALQWMDNKKIIIIRTEPKEFVSLDRNGKEYLKNGLPERRFINAIKDSPLKLEKLQESAGLTKQEVNATLGILRQKAAISMENGKISLTEQGRKWLARETFEEGLLNKLDRPLDTRTLTDEDRFAFNNLKKRKGILLVSAKKVRTIELTESGKRLITHKLDDKSIDRLTPSMLIKGGWKKKKFRHYDVSINVPKVSGGRRHFVNQAIEYVKRVWLDLGFKEMSGGLVQTGFWNLDTLFVPQDHPARDLQDTFYIKDPKYGHLPKRYTKEVKATHENGWKTGGKGWGYDWSEDIAKENMLRTHTTCLSARTIASLKKEDLPAKFFSVHKVFRNEALSWKHLFEFIQVEGIVVDPKANFKHLKGYLKEFFRKLGFPDARVRPGHFPYTEPSAEVDVWHPEKKTWVELGGSGLFRPELTKPLFGKEVPVLAWGLGFDRSIMEYYGITDIRELYRNDLKQLREMKLWMR